VILVFQAVDSLIELTRLKTRSSGGRLLGSIVDIGEPVVYPLIAALEDEDRGQGVLIAGCRELSYLFIETLEDQDT
jgi:hypothetical protein